MHSRTSWSCVQPSLNLAPQHPRCCTVLLPDILVDELLLWYDERSVARSPLRNAHVVSLIWEKVGFQEGYGMAQPSDLLGRIDAGIASQKT